MAGYLPTWVGILLAVGGAEIFARHGYGGGVGYEWLAGLNFKNIDFSKSFLFGGGDQIFYSENFHKSARVATLTMIPI